MTKESKSESIPGKQTESFQCLDAIEISLYIEKEGQSFYEKAANNASDPRVKNMFKRLAQEEIEHIETLQTKVKFLQPAISVKRKKSSHLDLFISNELKGKVFPVSGTKAVQKFKSDMDALKFGIESEKRSIEILSSLLEKEKKLDVKAIFSHLMVEEKKHLALLKGLKKKI